MRANRYVIHIKMECQVNRSFSELLQTNNNIAKEYILHSFEPIKHTHTMPEYVESFKMTSLSVKVTNNNISKENTFMSQTTQGKNAKILVFKLIIKLRNILFYKHIANVTWSIIITASNHLLFTLFYRRFITNNIYKFQNV